MRWDDLAVFVAVAEAQGFTGAARQLGLPKSSVSRQIAALEASLDTTLFYRTTRRVTLTPAGMRLLERAGPHLHALARVTVDDPDDPSPLRLTTTPDLASAVLAEAVARYVAERPRARVEVRLTAQVVDLVGEGFDLGLRVHRAGLPDDPQLVASRIGHLALAAYAAPAYLARAGAPASIDDFAEHQLVGFSATDSLPATTRGVVQADDTRFSLAVTREGGGIGVLPTFLAAADVRAGLLVQLLPEWTAWTGTIWLVAPKNPHPPAHVAAFRAHLAAVLRHGGALAPDPSTTG